VVGRVRQIISGHGRKDLEIRVYAGANHSIRDAATGERRPYLEETIIPWIKARTR
jgi:hypothetical protein